MSARAVKAQPEIKPIYVIGGKDKFLLNRRLDEVLDFLKSTSEI